MWFITASIHFKPLSEEEKANTRKKITGGKNYFVHVGSLIPRKNIVTLVKAFALFKSETNSDQKLVLAGQTFWGITEVYAIIKESKLEKEVIFTGRLSDDVLANVLGAADALTFVPYYEGFGIPLVEAMQAGVPIITGNVTSLPEIAGDAALLVNPLDPSEINKAMTKIYTDKSLREQLIANGNIQKEKFSWDKSADLLWQSILKTIG
jgi:glycosyltransferase involved in cell wall biosynthesis